MDKMAEASAATESSEKSDSKPEKTLIQIDRFSSWYGDFQALHDLALQIPRHRVTSFIGPSGCGKSTLLKWINRMNDVIPGATAKGTMQMLTPQGDRQTVEIDILDPNVDVVR